MSVVSKDNAEHYIWGGNCDSWHLAKSAKLSVIQECIPSGASEVSHYHHESEQFFYVLSGKAMFEINNKLHQIESNQGIHVPAGALHKISNLTEQELHLLVISTPPSHADRVDV